LPGIDGHEFARRVRSSKWGRDMLMVALTGRGQEEDRRASAEGGLDAHFNKPIDPAELSSELYALEKARSRHS
jgi:CheY-like chemotaxis protein